MFSVDDATLAIRCYVVAAIMLLHACLLGAQFAGAQEGRDDAVVVSDGNALTGAVKADDSLSASAEYNALVGDGDNTVPEPARLVRPTRPRSCQLYSAPGGQGSAGSEKNELEVVAGPLIVDEWYYQTCTFTDTGELSYSGYWQYQPGDPLNPGPDLAALARQAFDQVPLVYPMPATSPAIDGDQITGLPTWLWIDPAGWGELSARAAIPGFWVEVMARPKRVVWDLGDGEEVICAGPGTPYDPNRPPEGQSTDCSHVYQYESSDELGGRYAASVTIVWSVGWQASTSATGVLADASRTTTFSLRVTERQAVVTYDP